MLGVLRYGHYGRPLLALPAEDGDATEWERMGMIAAIRPLIEAGRLSVFAVDSPKGDWEGWMRWVAHDVAGHIDHELGGGPQEIAVAGVSMGAYQAVALGLRRADRFPLAIGMSGNYFGLHEEVAAAPHDHLGYLRERLTVLLVVGQGRWEDTTRALDSTRHLAQVMQGRGLRCEPDVWGYDVPHDWPSWRAQIAHHLPRFC